MSMSTSNGQHHFQRLSTSTSRYQYQCQCQFRSKCLNPADLRPIYEGLCRGAAVGGSVHRAYGRLPRPGLTPGGCGCSLILLEGADYLYIYIYVYHHHNFLRRTVCTLAWPCVVSYSLSSFPHPRLAFLEISYVYIYTITTIVFVFNPWRSFC